MTDYSALKKAGKLTGTIKAAVAKHAAREAARATPVKPVVSRMLDARIVVPLGDDDLQMARRAGLSDYPRRRNWETPLASCTRKSAGYTVEDIDHGRYSSRCTYRHWTYRVWVTSYAWMSQTRGREIGYRRLTTVTHLRAPRGYRWGADNNGLLRLVSLADHRA